MYNLVSAVRFEESGFPCTKQHLDNQKWAQDSWALLGLKWTSLARVGHIYCHELVEELIKHDVGAHMDSDIILTEPILKVFEFISCRLFVQLVKLNIYLSISDLNVHIKLKLKP